MKAQKTNYKEIFINFLKSEAIKLALKKLLGSAALGGFKAWLVQFIIKYLYEEIAEPIIRLGFNTIGYYYYRENGKIIIKKIKEAKEENDKKKYRDSVNDIFN